MLIEISLPENRTVRIDRRLLWYMSATQAQFVEGPGDRHLVPDDEFNELILMSFYGTRVVHATRDAKGLIFRRQPNHRHHGRHDTILHVLLNARVRGIKAGRERQFRMSLPQQVSDAE